MEDPTEGSRKCIKDNSESSPGVKAEWCQPGSTSYNKTKGYRKVPGDQCHETDDVSQFLPDTILCKVPEELEFMLVAKRGMDSINITGHDYKMHFMFGGISAALPSFWLYVGLTSNI